MGMMDKKMESIYIYIYIWVVITIMVPFWIPIIIRQLIFRVPQKGVIILTTTHMISSLLGFGVFKLQGVWSVKPSLSRGFVV